MLGGEGDEDQGEYSLFIFVQGGLQQAQGINQASCKAQLLARCSPQPTALGAVLAQIKLLLSLFADQLGLQEERKSLQGLPELGLSCSAEPQISPTPLLRATKGKFSWEKPVWNRRGITPWALL